MRAISNKACEASDKHSLRLVLLLNHTDARRTIEDMSTSRNQTASQVYFEKYALCRQIRYFQECNKPVH